MVRSSCACLSSIGYQNRCQGDVLLLPVQFTPLQQLKCSTHLTLTLFSLHSPYSIENPPHAAADVAAAVV